MRYPTSVVPANQWWWIENVMGLVDPLEGDWLARAAYDVPKWQAIVEIGTHTGQSTLWMAAGSMQGNHAEVYAIDPWPDPGYAEGDDPFDLKTGEAVYQRFLDNLRGISQSVPGTDYSDIVTPIRLTSAKANSFWAVPIGLLFIDAIHTYEGVKADVEMWEPFLEKGGWLALNDYYQDPERSKLHGAALYAKEVLEPSKRFQECTVVWNTWVGRKVD